MSINDKTKWREKELSYDQVIEKYPDIPPILALKIAPVMAKTKHKIIYA